MTILVGDALIPPDVAYEDCSWKCPTCRFVHSRTSDLPRWKNWPRAALRSTSMPARRFWQGFFRIYTEHAESYWKQCNVCGRVQPFLAYSKHVAWGPLERQMECRSCKGAINAVLNPKRTKEQLHEAGVRRRIADLLLEGENERISFKDLFGRFGSKCFKTGRRLDIKARGTWAVDHILPSRYLYPLTVRNACLLSAGANQAKKALWPTDFYTNQELVRLARMTGADLNVLSGTPTVNTAIDVDRCVARFLSVRERSNLNKRIVQVRTLLRSYGLVPKLSAANRKMLGL